MKYLSKNKIINAVEKRFQRKAYTILIVLMTLGAIYYYFFEPLLIGHDNRYIIYVFALPTGLGIVALGVYRRKFLMREFLNSKGFFLRSFIAFFYFLQGCIFSYLSIGQLSKIGFDIVNAYLSSQSPKVQLNCDITAFSVKRNSNRVEFLFSGRFEQFHISYSTIKMFKDENLNSYQLIIQARKGIWNYYSVENSSIVRR